MWTKETAPLKLHDAYMLDPYPQVDGSDTHERLEQLLHRQENMLRMMNLNLARSAELQRVTNRSLNILIGLLAFVVFVIMVSLG